MGFKMILPHGGTLIQRTLSEEKSRHLVNRAEKSQQLQLTPWSLSDLDLIATGAFSPLIGFMNQKDYQSVLNEMRLFDGTVWSLPITLAVSENEASKYKIGEEIVLKNEDNKVCGVLHLEEMFKYDKEQEA